MPVRREFSVGGLAVDPEGRLALVRTRNFKGDVTWTLPKGHPEPGESPADTALREVAEETALAVELDGEEPAASIDYWFTARNGDRVHKQVDWYVMRIVGETGLEPDAVEVEEVALLAVENAVKRLTYRGERKVVREALGA